MSPLKQILDKAHVECTKNNCQSWNNIAILAMEYANSELIESIIDKFEILISDENSSKDDFINLIRSIETQTP